MNPENSLILIVDDEATMRRSMADLLKLEGYQTVTAKDGMDAIEKITNRSETNPNMPFDLILLDLKMPGKDGLEVLRHANRLSPETQIILLTAHGSLQSAIEALQHGIHDYILKPALPEKIIQSVNKGLRKRSDQKFRTQLANQLEKSVQALRNYPNAGSVGIKLHNKDEFSKLKEANSGIENKRYIIEGVSLLIDQRKIISEHTVVNLTPSETRLLFILVENRDHVLNTRDLVFNIQGYETDHHEASNIIRPLVSRLRRKLSEFPDGKNWIKCIRSRGYLFQS